VGVPILSRSRLVDGEHDELRGADVDELLDQCGQIFPRRRHDPGDVVDVGTALRQDREQLIGDLTEAVRDQDAVVVRLDLTIVFLADPFDLGASGGEILGEHERREPAVRDAPMRRNSDGA
jgi:hypothetical protein